MVLIIIFFKAIHYNIVSIRSNTDELRQYREIVEKLIQSLVIPLELLKSKFFT